MSRIAVGVSALSPFAGGSAWLVGVTLCGVSHSERDSGKAALRGSNAPASPPSRTWSRSYKPDPRIAFGKYSPLEKEILVSVLKSARRAAL